MTDAHLWAAVALAAILGCGFLLYLLARTILPNANAMKVLHDIDARFDERIRAVLQKYQDREALKKPQAITGSKPAQQATNPLAEIFGGEPLLPVMEQPDSGEELEVVGA